MGKICYANKGNQCRILTVSRCIGENCSFFKTSEDQKEEIKKANVRIASLDKATQKYIADTYYKGRYPWLEVGECHGC